MVSPSSIRIEKNEVYFNQKIIKQDDQELSEEIKSEDFFSDCIRDQFVNRLGTWIYDMSQHPLPAMGPKGFERLETVLKTNKFLKKKYFSVIPEPKRSVLRKKLDQVNWKYAQADLKSPFKIGVDSKGDYVSIEVPIDVYNLIFYILQRYSHLIERVPVYGGAGSWIPHPEYYEKANRILQSLGRKKKLSEDQYLKLDIQPPDLDTKLLASQATNDEINLIYISILDYFISLFPYLNGIQNNLRFILSEILFTKKSVIYSEEAGKKNDLSILKFGDVAGFDFDLSIVRQTANNQFLNCHGWAWDIKEVVQKNQFNGEIVLYPIADASQGWQTFFDKISRSLSVVDLYYPYYLGWEKFIVFISRGYSSPNSELERNLQKNLNTSNMNGLCNNLIKCSSEHHLKGRLNATIVLLNASIYLEKLPQKEIQLLWEYFKGQEGRFKDNLLTPLWVDSLIQVIIDGSLQIKDIITIFQMVTFLVETSQRNASKNFENFFDECATYKHISFENSGSIKIPYNFSEILNKMNDFLSCDKYFNNPFLGQICSNFFSLNSEFSPLKNLELNIYDNKPSTSQIKRFFRFVLHCISFRSTEDSKILIKEAYELMTSDIDINMKSFCYSILNEKLCEKTIFENFNKVLFKNFTKEIALFFLIKDLMVEEINVAYEVWKISKNELSEKYYIIIGRIIAPDSLLAFIEVLMNIKEISIEELQVYKQFVLKCSKNLLSLNQNLDLITATHLMMKNKNVSSQDILNVSKNLLLNSKMNEVWNLIVAFKSNSNECLDRDLQSALLTCLEENFKNKDISLHSLFALWKKGVEDSFFSKILQDKRYVSFLNQFIERCLVEKEEIYAALIEKELSLQKDDFSKNKLVEIIQTRINEKMIQNLSIEEEVKSYSIYLDDKKLILYLCYNLKKNVEQSKVIDSFDTIFEILRLSEKPVPCEIKECFFEIIKNDNLLKDSKTTNLCFHLITHPKFLYSLSMEEIKEFNILISTKAFSEVKTFKREGMFFLSNAIGWIEVGDKEYALHFIPYIFYAFSSNSTSPDIIKVLMSKRCIIFTILYDLGRYTDVCSLFHLMNIASGDLIVPEICCITVKSIDVIFDDPVYTEVHNLIFQCLIICIKKNQDDSSIYALIKKMIAVYLAKDSQEKLNSILQILFIPEAKNYSKGGVISIVEYFSKAKMKEAFTALSHAYEKKIVSSEEVLALASGFISSRVDDKNDRVYLEIFQWIAKKNLILQESILSDFLIRKIEERSKEGFELILELFVTLSTTSSSFWNFVIAEKSHIDKDLLNKFFIQLSNVVLSGNLEENNIDEIYKLCWNLFEYSKSNPHIIMKILSEEIKSSHMKSETSVKLNSENQKSSFLTSQILTNSQLEYEKRKEFLYLCLEVFLILFKHTQVSDSHVEFFISFKIRALKLLPDFCKNNIIQEINQEVLNYSLKTTNEVCYKESCFLMIKMLTKNREILINDPLYMGIIFNYPKIIKKNNLDSELIEEAICLILKNIYQDLEKSEEACLNVCKAFIYVKSNKILGVVSSFVLTLFKHMEDDIEPPEFLGDLLKGIFSCCSSQNSLEILNNPVFIKFYDNQFQNKGWAAYLLFQNNYQYPNASFCYVEQISLSKEIQLKEFEITLKEKICTITKNNIFRIKNFDAELKTIWKSFWNNIFFLYEHNSCNGEPWHVFCTIIFNIFFDTESRESTSNPLPVNINTSLFDSFPFNNESLELMWKNKKFIDLKNEFISIFFSKKLLLNFQTTLGFVNLIYNLIKTSILSLDQTSNKCNEKAEIAEMVESFAFYSITLRNDQIFTKARLFTKELCMTAFFHDVFEKLEKKLAACIFIVDLAYFQIVCESYQKYKMSEKMKKKILCNLIDKMIEMKNPTALRHGVALLCKVGSLFKKNEIFSKFKRLFEEVAINAYEPTNYLVFEIIEPDFQSDSMRNRVPLHEAVRSLIMDQALPLFNARHLNSSKIKGFDRTGFQLMKLYAHALLNSRPSSDFQIILSFRFKNCCIIQTILKIIKTGAEIERFYDSYTDYFDYLLKVQPMLFEWMSEFVDFEKFYKDYEDLLFIEFMDKSLDISKIQSIRLSVIQQWFLLVFNTEKESVFNRAKKTLMLAFKHKLYLEQDALLNEIRPLLTKKFS